MAHAALASLLHFLRSLHNAARVELSDRELLRQYVANHDQAAFAALLHRHASLVWSVCRRLLDNEHDAEDAFQAVFLVLLRKSASLRVGASLANWLHTVATRIALKSRVTTLRRLLRERQAVMEMLSDPYAVVEGRDLRVLLDEELDRLPEKYRSPLVLCYLEGMSYTEAARQLGWRDGTLCGRLARARELLRKRLSRRCLTLSGAALAAALTESAAAPATTVAAVARMAAVFALGQAAGSGAVSSSVATLAQGVMQAMTVAKVKTVVALGAVFCVLACGGGLAAHWFWTAKELPLERTEAPPAAKNAEQPRKEPLARTDRYGDPLPPGAVARLGTVRLRHPQFVNSVMFTPDGKFLASAGWEGTIRLWNPATGKELRRFEGDSNVVFGIAISPDGKTLASAGNSGLIRVWDVPSRKCRFFVKGHEGSYVTCVAISPDGKWLASGGGGNRTRTLMLWDLATSKEVRRLGDNMRTVRSVAFSPNGKFLAAASDVRPTHGNPKDREGPGVVRLWDVTTGKLRWEKEEETGGATSVAFAPTGKTIASAGYDSVVHIRDVATGKEFHKIQVPESRIPVEDPAGRRKGYNWGGVLALAYSPDGKLLASAGYDGTVRLWETDTGKELRILPGHARKVASLAFSPDGKVLASGSDDHTIRLWDPVNGKLLHAPAGHDGEVIHMAVFPDGQSAASVGADRTIRLWELTTERELVVLRGHTKPILSLLISPDGKTLVSASEDKTIRLWDVDSGSERGRILGPTAEAYSLSISPDGKLLAWTDGKKLISADGKVSGPPIGLSELATGREARRMEGGGQYYGVRFSPSGKWLAAYAFGHGVDFWEVATGKRRRAFDDLIDFAFVPNTETLVGWCKDGMVRFRSFVDGRESLSFQGPSRPNWVQRPFAISQDGRTLLFGTEGNIQLWEAVSGRVRRTFSGHTSLITDGAFAPDGRTLLSASWDTTVLVWDVARQTEERRGKLGQTELQALWQDLTGADAVKADQAIWALAAGTEQAVPFLRKHLRPVPAVESSRLSHLLADLDSEQFAVRDKATRELEELGELAVPVLRNLLADKPSLESRRRAERLLEKLRGPLSPGEKLRSLRAVEVLEHIGTLDARKVLATLAEGTPQARLTREAKAALDRLSRQQPVRTP